MEHERRELTAKEAAAYLGYTLQSFYNRVADIRHRKIRGALYFRPKDLDEYAGRQIYEHIPEPEDAA